MKRGCFLKSIFILTIVVAVVFYLIQTKWDEWVVTPGKKLLQPIVENEIEENLSFLYDSPEKDSLKSIISSYISELKFLSDKDSLENLLSNKMKDFTLDSLISQEELEEIKTLIEKLK